MGIRERVSFTTACRICDKLDRRILFHLIADTVAAWKTAVPREGWASKDNEVRDSYFSRLGLWVEHIANESISGYEIRGRLNRHKRSDEYAWAIISSNSPIHTLDFEPHSM
jgi:hypothetical protein